MLQTFDPNRNDFEPYGLSVTRWQPTTMNRTDRHNEIELNWVLSQPVTFQVGGHRVVVPPGGLMLFWAAIPHQLVAPVGDQAYYVATIPLNMFLRFELPQAMVQAALGGLVLSCDIDLVLPAAETCLESWIADIDSGDSLRRQATVLELQALLLRIWSTTQICSEPFEASSVHGLRQADLSAVERIAAFLALHYTEPLTVDQVSSAIGLNSGYAMTLFRQVFGQTIMENVLHHRLAHAQRLLISTQDQILTIAYESGFGSLSRFNTAFKQHCGCSPRQYRKLYGDPCWPGGD